ncbi:MAG: PAS domain S-box protein [Xanthomonadales bacterium]|nr:PAS domain S-box protein [Xanthomonadales bacterium]
MVDAIPADIVLVDGQGRVVASNAPGLGIADPPARGDDFVAHYLHHGEGVVPPSAWEAADAVVELLTGRRGAFDIEYAWPDGVEERWLRLVGRPVPPGAGDGAVLVRMDITARRDAQEAVRRSEEKYRLLFRRNPHPMWVYDLESLRFLEVNGRAVERYGWSEREFLSMTIEDIRPVGDRARLAAFDATRREGMVNAGVWTHLSRDGETLLAEVHADDIVYAGRPARIVMAVDITERRRLEEQLAQSQRLEALGQLTGGVAHDFNNLLTVMQGNAELLTEALAGERPDLAELAGMIGAAADLGGQLTSRLLAFGRRQPLAPTRIDVAALVQGMLPLLRRSLGGGVDITVAGAPARWCALADAGQLENALLNLCLNARDAMPAGGRLLLETSDVFLDADYAAGHPGVQAGDHVLLAVTDTGCGIAPADLPRVFEPFFTTKQRGHGTGLGLSMVWGFVKQSRGHVAVYSEAGVGTTVRVYLPRADAVAGQPRALPVPAEPPARGSGECVLLVEDDDLVREYAREQLLALGYRVRVAASGSEALALLGQAPDIDVLFTDVVMPGRLDGRQLATAARDLRPALPVLYASGFPENALSLDGRLEANVVLLSKPYRRADLARKLRLVLDACPSPGTTQ